MKSDLRDYRFPNADGQKEVHFVQTVEATTSIQYGVIEIEREKKNMNLDYLFLRLMCCESSFF